MAQENYETEPCYVISVAARMVGLHAQTLRYYERAGLLQPSRSMGKRRLYSPIDIERLRRIKLLTEDMGVNLAGVEVVLKLMTRMAEMENEMNHLWERLNGPSPFPSVGPTGQIQEDDNRGVETR